jgi:hypothetical protein
MHAARKVCHCVVLARRVCAARSVFVSVSAVLHGAARRCSCGPARGAVLPSVAKLAMQTTRALSRRCGASCAHHVCVAAETVALCGFVVAGSCGVRRARLRAAPAAPRVQLTSSSPLRGQIVAESARALAPIVAGTSMLGLVRASEDHMEPPSYPFAHKGFFTSFDAARYVCRRAFHAAADA